MVRLSYGKVQSILSQAEEAAKRFIPVLESLGRQWCRGSLHLLRQSRYESGAGSTKGLNSPKKVSEVMAKKPGSIRESGIIMLSDFFTCCASQPLQTRVWRY